MEGAKHTGFRVCLARCGIGWLNNVEHMEINALGTISLNLTELKNGVSSRHENQPGKWLSCIFVEANVLYDNIA
jgi:hypothetical protein